MENYSYSSYPESGDSSPRSREIDVETAAAACWEDAPPPSSAILRVKLMCSYGGRIQPRPHDNQLSYVGGDTKILTVDRSLRFPSLLAKLASLAGSAPDDLCFKYQLPGEDLDALISVTNDEDLDHMMLEYDRLLRSAAKSVPRLRLFLFPLARPPLPDSSTTKPDRHWFVDALNSVPDSLPPPPPPPPSQLTASPPSGPDYLFGLDASFVPPPPPPTVVVKDPPPQLTVEIPPISDPERPPTGGDSSSEMQRQIQELQRIQIADAQEKAAAQPQQQQPPPPATAIQRNGSEETLVRVYPPEYYAPPRVPEKAPPPQPPASSQIPAGVPPPAYWAEPRAVPATRYASVAGGDQPFYLIPAGQGYYAAVPRVVGPDGLYRDAAVYAMAPPPQPAAPAKMVASYAAAADGGVARTQGAAEAGFAAPQVAYDSAGRAVYYTSAVPTYQTVTSVGLNPDGTKVAARPPQVS